MEGVKNAVTKILARKARLDVGINYVLNGDKTEDHILTAYLNCDPGFACRQMMDTKQNYGKEDGVLSVTIVGDSGLLCDGLSTALFVMGPERAVEFWRETGGFEAVLLTEDGQLILTEGLTEQFSPLGEYEGAEITVVRHN